MPVSFESARYFVTRTYRATFKRQSKLRNFLITTARLLKAPAFSNMTRSPSSVSHINEHPTDPFSSKVFLTEEATSPNIVMVSMFNIETITMFGEVASSVRKTFDENGSVGCSLICETEDGERVIFEKAGALSNRAVVIKKLRNLLWRLKVAR